MSSLAQPRGLNINLQRGASRRKGLPARSAARLAAAARQRTRNALVRLGLLVAVVMVIAALQSGCASPGSVAEYNYESPAAKNIGTPGKSKNERPAGTAASRDGAASKVAFDAPDNVTPETRRLAQQSERDVDLLLKAQQERAAGNAGAGGGGVTNGGSNTAAAINNSPASSAAPAQRAVVWNDAPRPKPAAAANAGPAASAQPTALTAAASPPSSQPAATQPDPATLRPDRIKQLTVDLARELYAAGAYSDHPLRELTAIAAMSMVQPERRIDPIAIPDLTDEERQVLASLQTFFGDIGKCMEQGGSGQVGDGVAHAAATLRQSLVHEPHLKLPRIALCTRVGGFGDYAPFAHYSFLAGTEQKAIVYLEIADFVSEINQNNEYVTELSQQLTMYSDRDGIPVWKEDWQAATDVTRNKRQDFFTVQVITLPKPLSVGKYTLKVRVRDEKSKAEAETSIPFELVADAKMIK